MAHTAQIAKMAQAFTQQVDRFELITTGDWVSLGKRVDPALQEWYGLKHPLPLVRLPVHWRRPPMFLPDYHNRILLSASYSLCLPALPRFDLYPHHYPGAYLAGLGYPSCGSGMTPQPQHQDIVDSPSLLGLATILPQLVEDYRAVGLGGNPNPSAYPAAPSLEAFHPYQTQAQARQVLNFAQPSAPHPSLQVTSRITRAFPRCWRWPNGYPIINLCWWGVGLSMVDRLRRQVQDWGLTDVLTDWPCQSIPIAHLPLRRRCVVAAHQSNLGIWPIPPAP
jgi:hypothetical protein